jgi:hypothetical protein
VEAIGDMALAEVDLARQEEREVAVVVKKHSLPSSLSLPLQVCGHETHKRMKHEVIANRFVQVFYVGVMHLAFFGAFDHEKLQPYCIEGL